MNIDFWQLICLIIVVGCVLEALVIAWRRK